MESFVTKVIRVAAQKITAILRGEGMETPAASLGRDLKTGLRSRSLPEGVPSLIGVEQTLPQPASPLSNDVKRAVLASECAPGCSEIGFLLEFDKQMPVDEQAGVTIELHQFPIQTL